MSKVFKALGTISGIASAVLAFVPGAQPIAAALSINSVIMGTLAKATAKKPPAQGSMTTILIQANAPTPYLMGETYYGGVMRHDVGYGGKVSKVQNPYRELPIVYSGCGPVDGLVGMYADFIAVPFSGAAATGYYAGFMYRDYQLGLTPEPDALAPQWPGMPGWSSAHKLSGKAAIMWGLKFDKEGEKYQGSVPQLGAVWRGVRVYDPRLDSTRPGGSGSHRITNEATWSYSQNPALHALTYAYGRYRSGKKIFGIGLPAASILIDDYVAWANVCDANNWKIGGVIFEPGDRWANLKRIMAAGSAEPIFAGGALSVKYDAPRVSLVTITAEDMADSDGRVRAMQTWRDRINTIVPKYRSAAHKWEFVESAAIVGDSYLAEDGEEKIDTYQVDLCQDKDQAAQLAAYRLVNGREISPIDITLKPGFRFYRPGDMVTLDIPEMGLVDQDCVIIRRVVDPQNFSVQFTLMSETAAKHDFALGKTGTAPPTPTLTSPEDKDLVAQTNALGGQAFNAVFKRSATQPSTPGDSSGTPSGWYADTGSVPAGADPIWVAFGQRENSISDYIWQTPVRAEGEDGTDGAAGLNNAVVYLYKRGATSPAAPSGTFTYTFATGALSGGTLNGWTQAIPAADGNPLWVIAATASAATSTDSVPAAEFSSPVLKDGAGLNAATVFLYQRAASTPSVPGSTTTYTFATGVLSGTLGSWSQTAPANDGNPLYLITATAVGTGTTDTIATGEWSTARVIATNGADGAPGSNGLNNAVVYLYRRGATSPSAPSGTFTYTFATGVLSGGTLNGWTQAIPASDGNPLWVIAATASANTATDSIAAAEFTSPVLKDGAGLNAATVALYQRAASSPSVPAGTLTYTFSTGALSGSLGSWSQTAPAHNGNPLYMITATALGAGTTDTIATGEWSTPQIIASNGTNGADGTSPPLIVLTSSHQTFRYDTSGSPLSQSTTLQAARQNTAGTTQWQLRKADGTVAVTWTTAALMVSAGGADSSPDNDTLVLNQARFQTLIAFLSTPALIYECRISTATSVTDRKSIAKVQDGAAGDDGANGLSIAATLPIIAVARTASGALKPSELPKTTQMIVYDGFTDITSSCTYSRSVSDCSVSNDGGGAFTMTAVTDLDAYFDVTAEAPDGREITMRIVTSQPLDGSAASRVSASLASMSGTGSFVSIGSVDIVAAAGATISGAASTTYQATNTGAGTRTVRAEAKISIQNLTDSGSESDGSAIIGSAASYIAGDGPSDIGQVSAGHSVTNSTGAPKTFRIRFYIRKYDGLAGINTTGGTYAGTIAGQVA